MRKAAEAVQRSIAGVEEDVEKENGKGTAGIAGCLSS